MWKLLPNSSSGMITTGGGSLSLPMQIIILMTLLTLLPAMVMAVTPFLRISIVLHFLRQALGTQSAPSNQVLIGIALFLTILVMQPIVIDMYEKGWAPVERGEMSWQDGFDAAATPLRTFLLRYTREKDIALFIELSHQAKPRKPDDLAMSVLIPAYILSELKAGFQIGAVLYLPFLV